MRTFVLLLLVPFAGAAQAQAQVPSRAEEACQSAYNAEVARIKSEAASKRRADGVTDADQPIARVVQAQIEVAARQAERCQAEANKRAAATAAKSKAAKGTD